MCNTIHTEFGVSGGDNTGNFHHQPHFVIIDLVLVTWKSKHILGNNNHLLISNLPNRSGYYPPSLLLMHQAQPTINGLRACLRKSLWHQVNEEELLHVPGQSSHHCVHFTDFQECYLDFMMEQSANVLQPDSFVANFMNIAVGKETH